MRCSCTWFSSSGVASLHGSGKGFVTYEHLVIDEVQDLSACEVKVLIDSVSSGRPVPNAGLRRGSCGHNSKKAEKAKSITMAGDGSSV